MQRSVHESVIGSKVFLQAEKVLRCKEKSTKI